MSEVLEAPARPAFANFVGGEWSESVAGETYEKRGPWRPSDVIGAFPSSGAADVDRAVAAARAAFPAWAGLPAAQRGAVLSRAADAIDQPAQLAQDNGLGEIVVGTVLDRQDRGGEAGVGGHDDDWHILQRRIGA